MHQDTNDAWGPWTPMHHTMNDAWGPWTPMHHRTAPCITPTYAWHINVASVFRLLTPRIWHLVSSFNKKNDQCIKAHLLRWFPAILKNLRELRTRSESNVKYNEYKQQEIQIEKKRIKGVIKVINPSNNQPHLADHEIKQFNCNMNLRCLCMRLYSISI